MANPNRRCPVCLCTVRRSCYGKIASHRDSLGFDQCPATGEPWRIAEPWWPRAHQKRSSRMMERCTCPYGGTFGHFSTCPIWRRSHA